MDLLEDPNERNTTRFLPTVPSMTNLTYCSAEWPISPVPENRGVYDTAHRTKRRNSFASNMYQTQKRNLGDKTSMLISIYSKIVNCEFINLTNHNHNRLFNSKSASCFFCHMWAQITRKNSMLISTYIIQGIRGDFGGVRENFSIIIVTYYYKIQKTPDGILILNCLFISE